MIPFRVTKIRKVFYLKSSELYGTEVLIKETVYQCQKVGRTSGDNVPQPLCSAYEHLYKETAV